MKVFYNGLNLHRQFPSGENIVENFIDHVYHNLEQIEVSYHHAVLLVAGTVILQGARNEKFEIGSSVSTILCYEDKILALLSNGDLLRVADNVVKVPKLMDLDNDSIKLVSCGSKLTVALTRNGKLYNVPNKLNFEDDTIIDVKTGREHCLLLDKRGNVFSFGRGSRGQLGHGCLDDEDEPRLIEALGGIRIKAVETGGWHSCALSADGDLYVWGWNSNGQLGLADENVSVMATPRVLDLDFNIEKIGCGTRHTVVLSENGILYGCGWNKYRQLKSDEEECFKEMIRIWDFSKEIVISLKCGPWNTLVLCEDSLSQLGHSGLDDEDESRLIGALSGIRIKALETGGWHSWALSTEYDLHVWGWNSNGQLGLTDKSVSVMATAKALYLEFNIEMIGCGTRHTVVLSENGTL